jgi:hypothetical protein
MFFLIVPVTALIILNLAQHPESPVPFQPSSEPCHFAEPFLGSYQIYLAHPVPFIQSLFVTALASILDQQQSISLLFLI